MKFGVEYSYEEICNYLIQLKEKYPTFLHVMSIGKTSENRSILMLIFGCGVQSMVAVGGVHGRESINPIVLIQMAEDWLSCMKERTVPMGRIYLIPVLNPDGYERARTGDIDWKGNAKGRDINRNFPSVLFKKKWIGDTPASEEETKALLRILDIVHPDGLLDYHSRGQSIYYYRGQMSDYYNRRQYQIACSLQLATGYRLEYANDEVLAADSGGNTVHYLSERYQKPALTIETVPEEAPFPLSLNYQESTYQEIKSTFQVFLESLAMQSS